MRPVSEGMPRPNNRRLSLANALPDIQDLMPSLQELPILCTGQDELVWKWGSTGNYTAKSAYEILLSAGKVRWGFHKLWTAKCPKTTKIFAYLMLRGRTLTQDVMRKRMIHCEFGCVLCLNCPIESALHLFFLCPYAVHVWFLVSAELGIKIFSPQGTVEQIWHESLKVYKQSSGGTAKNWIMWFVCVTWFLWKERNERIFRGRRPPNIVADKILAEGRLWASYC